MTQEKSAASSNAASQGAKTSSKSRRDFIKTSSGALAAGTLVGGSLSLARSAHAAGNDEIKIGLVGCGGRGTGAAGQALNTTSGPIKLVAMGDAFDNRLKASLTTLKNTHADKLEVPDERQFVGLDAYKRVLESDIDLVILATPPGFRPLHVEAAIEANKHVFMEKPVAVDGPGVRRVLAATEKAKEKNLAIAVGLQRHHEPAYIDTITQLKEGAIGDINFCRAYWNGGGVWVRPRQPDQTELEYQMNNWYYFNWLCGDHIVEQHIHNLDVINWLKDGFPTECQGQGGREVRKGKDFGQIFDHHALEYTYADGSKMLSNCRHIKGCWNSVSEHAHGSEGSADISRFTIYDKSGKTKWTSSQERVNGWQQEHHDLFANIRNGIIPNEGEYGAKSTLTAIMGRMATYTGKVVTFEQALNSELSLCDVDSLKSMDDKAPLYPDDAGDYFVAVPGQSWKEVL